MGFFELLAQTYPQLLLGLWITVESTLISLIIAAFLGLLFGLMSVSKKKVARGIARVYVDIIRGTPIIVQAFFIYFGITSALGIRMTPLVAGIVALSLNAGAYSAEIFRGGIQAIARGQMEAARSLGLPYSMAMRKVILPQAVRTMLPSLVNQCIITLKDSSIMSVIGLADLTFTGKIIIANNLESFKMWLMVGILYFIVISLLSYASKVLERRMSYAKG